MIMGNVSFTGLAQYENFPHILLINYDNLKVMNYTKESFYTRHTVLDLQN